MRPMIRSLNGIQEYVGGCQNYGPLLGTLNIRGRTIIGIQKGTIILTTTHVELCGVCGQGSMYLIVGHLRLRHYSSCNTGFEEFRLLWSCLISEFRIESYPKP